jgi:hypothetical protein
MTVEISGKRGLVDFAKVTSGSKVAGGGAKVATLRRPEKLSLQNKEK